MRRQWPIWTVFAVCLALGLGAMGWISLKVLQLDRNEARARHQAEVEGSVRLALWRMDTMIAPVIAQENARPYFVYSSFFPAGRAYPYMFAEMQKGDVLMGSPLLGQPSPLVKLYFQIAPDDTVSSPQVPSEPTRSMAEAHFTTAEKIAVATQLISELKKNLNPDELLSELPEATSVDGANNPLVTVVNNSWINAATTNPTTNTANDSPNQQNQEPQQGQRPQQHAPPPKFPSQQEPQQQQQGQQPKSSLNERYADISKTEAARSEQEFMNRTWSLQTLSDAARRNKGLVETDPRVIEGVMLPVWRGDSLLLARRVSIQGRQYVQGCWFDWAAIKKMLLDNVADLLPGADLVATQKDTRDPRMLAALPVKLIVPERIFADTSSPIRLTLLVAWCSAALGAMAIALVLRGLIVLSDRRGAFVSAVTHELRTPLTTLRMYTEMLAEGMVTDPAKQKKYFSTLRGETNRLGHLVENVLGYSRLERKRSGGHARRLSLGELLGAVMHRLQDRAAQASMTLEMEITPEMQLTPLHVDPVSVEQILFNLVDNACKYARSSSTPVIRIDARREEKSLVMEVRDYGQGFSREQAKKLFDPFSKTVSEAAEKAAPGLGLGLALSRRLARDMGGDLSLKSGAEGGATFVLTLPVSVEA